MQFRQGDVFLMKVSEPKGEKQKASKGRVILQEGEVTGHAHAIPASYAKDVNVFLEKDRRFLEVCATVPLQHEEHSTINLDPGIYEVRIQKTWSVVDKLAQNVRD